MEKSENHIELEISKIPLEKEPSLPFQYTAEIVGDIEKIIGQPLPDDFKWYLLNIGWRKIAFGFRSFLLKPAGYIYNLKFESVVHQAFSISQLNQLQENNNSKFLPEKGKDFFPFGKMEGEINPSVVYQLLLKLDEDNQASVWAMEALPFSAKGRQPQIIMVATGFINFLQQLISVEKATQIAVKNNDGLFLEMLNDYLKLPRLLPTVLPDYHELMDKIFSTNQPIIIDGARHVEYQYLANSSRVEDFQNFSERALVFENNISHTWLVGGLERKEINYSSPGC